CAAGSPAASRACRAYGSCRLPQASRNRRRHRPDAGDDREETEGVAMSESTCGADRETSGRTDAGGASPGLEEAESGPAGLSRRSMLKAGALAAATLAGSASRAQPGAPAVATGSVAGRPFRAFVRHGTTSSVEDLRL